MDGHGLTDDSAGFLVVAAMCSRWGSHEATFDLLGVIDCRSLGGRVRDVAIDLI